MEGIITEASDVPFLLFQRRYFFRIFTKMCLSLTWSIIVALVKYSSHFWTNPFVLAFKNAHFNVHSIFVYSSQYILNVNKCLSWPLTHHLGLEPKVCPVYIWQSHLPLLLLSQQAPSTSSLFFWVNTSMGLQ